MKERIVQLTITVDDDEIADQLVEGMVKSLNDEFEEQGMPVTVKIIS